MSDDSSLRQLVRRDRDAWALLDTAMPVGELYHEASKLTRATLPDFVARIETLSARPDLRKQMAYPFKTYGKAQRLRLPRDENDSHIALLLRERRSRRQFDGTPVAKADLAVILCGTYGLVHDRQEPLVRRRPVPSAGALYPLEFYVAVFRGQDLPEGLYHYAPQDHTLELLGGGSPYLRFCSSVLVGDIGMDQACAAILITGVFRRNATKYGERAYRFVLLEAGIASLAMTLSCQERGLGGVLVGGFLDDEVNRWLGVDGVEESCLLVSVIGTPAESR